MKLFRLVTTGDAYGVVRVVYATANHPNDLVKQLVENPLYPERQGHYLWLGGCVDDTEPTEKILSPEELRQVVLREREFIEKRKSAQSAPPRDDLPYEVCDDLEEFTTKRENKRRLFRQQHPYRAILKEVRNHIRWAMNGWTPRDLKLAVLKRTQRAQRGWSDQDAWGADYYLANVIADMLEQLRKWHTGVPMKRLDELTVADWRGELLDLNMGTAFREEEWWDDIVLRIVLAFRRYNAFHHDGFGYSHTTPEERAWIEQEFTEAGRLFIKYFGGFWD